MVSRVLDPLLHLIEDTAGRLPRVDQAAYTLNCVYQIHSSLSLYEHVEERLENLQVALTLTILEHCCILSLFIGVDGESVSSSE